jgi:rhomboid family GlyGly-CTERM serine protease
MAGRAMVLGPPILRGQVMQTLSANEMDRLRVAEDGAVRTPRPTFHLPASRFIGFVRQRPEIIFFVALIAIFNVPVLFGSVWGSMMFQPEAVRSGEWWRLLTHPFVHLTWYHLLLDGTAFLSLYCSLVERRIFARFAYLAAAAVGSLVASWVASPAIFTNGLCGLSGIAHGLMAISAIEMLGGDEAEQRIGWASLILVVGKGAFEAITGKMFFGFLDFELLGSPVAVSHAGGILGGLVVLLLFRIWKSKPLRIEN